MRILCFMFIFLFFNLRSGLVPDLIPHVVSFLSKPALLYTTTTVFPSIIFPTKISWIVDLGASFVFSGANYFSECRNNLDWYNDGVFNSLSFNKFPTIATLRNNNLKFLLATKILETAALIFAYRLIFIILGN